MYRKILQTVFLTAITACLAACNSVIYDDEGDCSVHYKLKFRYDHNIKFADAFAHEVESINLYACDENGKIVWSKTESGDALKKEGYAMELDLPAGKYHLVAWCAGINFGGDESEWFTIAHHVTGPSVLSDLNCRLNTRQQADGTHFSPVDLDGLFHGTLDVELPEDLDGGTYTYNMSLMKNTNHFRIILQHINGQEIDPNDFVFRIDEENALMGHDNELGEHPSVRYDAWHLGNGLSDMDFNGNRSRDGINVAMADLTVARLKADRKTYLTIDDSKTGRRIARIPLTDYAVLVKSHYGNMSNQEYLDRQDDYNMTFFLDEGKRWINTTIIINSWRVVLNDDVLD